MNWRISVRKTPEINAAGGIGNYIEINTGLYDSFYTNEDALAFTIAHEMSHIILGHQTRRAELEKKLERFIKVAGKSDVAKFADKVGVAVVAKQLRNLEFMADTEAIILLTKAGYDPNKAYTALNFMNAFGNIRTYWSDHPITRERVESYKQNMQLSDPNWVNVGKENIYNSEVLNAKKSSDRVTLVLDKAQNVSKFYEVEDLETRLTRIAYMSYLNGDFKNAVKYFENLSEADATNYVPYVYIALANEALYKSSNKSAYLTQAITAITKAKDLEPTNPIVNNYYNDLNKQNSL